MMKLTLTAVASVMVLAACGGGGGLDPNPLPGDVLRMTPKITDVGIFAGYSYKIAQFSYGVKPYFVLSNSTSVSGELDHDNYLYLNGNRVGAENEVAVVKVQDSSLGQASLSMNVKVAGLELWSSAGNSVHLMPGENFTTRIAGGAAPYRILNTNSGAVSAGFDASGNLVITALNPDTKPATAEVTVVDSVGNQTTITVTVKALVLNLYPSSITGATGGQASFRISGGVGPYTVTSDNLLIAVPHVNGDEVNVDLLTAGTANLTVVDKFGTTQRLTVTVRNRVIVITPDRADINENNNSTLSFRLENGKYPYTAALARSDRDVMSASIVEHVTIIPAVTDPVTGTVTTPEQRILSYTLDLGLGTQGNRCVTGDREVEVLVTDSTGAVTRLPVRIRDTGAC